MLFRYSENIDEIESLNFTFDLVQRTNNVHKLSLLLFSVDNFQTIKFIKAYSTGNKIETKIIKSSGFYNFLESCNIT